MNQSLQSKLSQVLPTENSGGTKQPKIIQNGLLVVTGKTLVFKNTLYQLSNITSIEFSDNTEIYTKPIPVWYWIVLVVGILTIPMFVGIFISGIACWLFYKHNQNKVKIREEYALRIEMTSSSSTLLLSSQKSFVQDVIQEIYENINSADPETITFDFGNYSVNHSISVGQSIGSALISGQVVGNIST